MEQFFKVGMSDVITEEDIKYYETISQRNGAPLVDIEEIKNNPNCSHVYLDFLSTLSPEQKGEDLGICAVVRAGTHKAQVGLDLSNSVVDISYQVNYRMLCHVMNLGIMFKAPFKDHLQQQDILEICVDGSTEVVSNFPENIANDFNIENEFERYRELGIKMVELFQEKVFDY